MLIQVNTDNHIQGNERLTTYVQGVIQDTLSRFAERITRVEVHLHDTNGANGGDNDKRCAIEVRLAGFDPVTPRTMPRTSIKPSTGRPKKMKTLLDRQFDNSPTPRGVFARRAAGVSSPPHTPPPVQIKQTALRRLNDGGLFDLIALGLN